MPDEREQSQIAGTVMQVVFKNDDNGYRVLQCQCGDEEVTLVGTLPTLCEGESFTAEGHWEIHPSYGQQFFADAITVTLPAEENAIMALLASEAFSGVGAVTAKKIVETFGAETFLIIETQHERLREVPGITYKKAEKIYASYQERFLMKRSLDFLRGAGLSAAEAVEVFRAFGQQTIEVISKNPYAICGAAIGLDFEKADQMAERLAQADYAKERMRAGVLHILRHNMKNGHTYLPLERLLPVAMEFLGQGSETLEQVVDDLCADGELMRLTINGDDGLYLPELFLAEQDIAAKLHILSQNRMEFPGLDKQIQKIEQSFGIAYDEDQKEAICGAMQSGVFIMTGGPGTGKTTILRAILRLCEQSGERVLLAAPTGRAAKRMGELTGADARTIHRMLGVEKNSGPVPSFTRNERTPLKADVIVVDECSMVDTMLFSALLRAVRPTARLILVGDSDQLPSIGPGNVLKDLIHSDCFDCVELTEIWRQAKESLIVVNAHEINRGEMPDITVKNNDFFFLPCRKEEELARLVVSLCRDRLPRAYGVNGIHDIQVVCPTKKTAAGTVYLNTVLQSALNPPEPGKPELRFRDVIYRRGDKVMHIRNNYQLEWEKADGEFGTGVFNGDVGEIVEVAPGSRQVKVRFDDRFVDYSPELLPELELAYAVTVHKSQGSEYPIVILPLISGPRSLFYRSLLYTAVTRASEKMIVVGREETLYAMVMNNRQQSRYCGLKEMICHEILTEG